MERQRSIFGPLLLITAGIMWLLIKAEIVPGENLWALTHIWPYFLIAAGLGLILRGYWRYATVFVDVLIIGGVILAIVFAPSFGWSSPNLFAGFWSSGVYLGPGERGSGNVISQTRDVPDFDSVEVGFPAQVFVSQGEVVSLKVEAEDNFLPGLRTDVRNGALEIFYRAEDGERVNPTEPVIVTLVVTNLNEIDFSSAGELIINGLEVETLDISLSGAGNMELNDIGADELSVALSGAGNMTASGNIGNLRVDINGFGNFDGGDLQADTARVALSGAGNATVWVTESLDAEISGAGSVGYYGNASVTRDISGLGGVKDLGDK